MCKPSWRLECRKKGVTTHGPAPPRGQVCDFGVLLATTGRGRQRRNFQGASRPSRFLSEAKISATRGDEEDEAETKYIASRLNEKRSARRKAVPDKEAAKTWLDPRANST